ncbi:MAG: hypothetical protein VR65_01800 [Desulfobulbaceae bacterium BRH_c16a]|nr:MAG: hypothetical protein VR65_01800 [Desulfobulbaceae bacterium BRH_c16a]
MKKYMILVAVLVSTNFLFGGLLTPIAAYAHHNDDDYGYNRGYYPTYRYYPQYRYRAKNPVVRRDYHSTEQYAPDGTIHEEETVVDRHSSYYSRGRNEAITRPRTTVKSWSNKPGQETTREKTTWIGADGRPHSTTVTRDTSVDRWGNTRTDTYVNLKKAKP